MAEGDLSFITNGLFDAGRGMNPSIVHIDGDVFAIAYRGPDNDGWLVTLTISADGTTIALTGSSLEFNIASGEFPHLIHVTGDIYAIAYWQLALDDGIVCTVSIDAAGNIGPAVLATFTFDAVRGRAPDIIHVSGNVYAIAYRGPLDDGFLITLTISADGTAIALTGSSLEFNVTHCEGPDITHISGDMYAIAYCYASGGGGKITTMAIDNAGNIGAIIADRIFDATVVQYPVILHIAGDVYAIVYTGSGNRGRMQTRTISAAGAIGNPEIDVLWWDAVQGIHPDFIQVSGHVYAIAARGPGDTGWLYTITIEADGQIGDAVLDTLEFDDRVSTEDPRLIQVAGSVFAIAYVYFVIPIPGYVATVDIEGEKKGMRGLNPALMEVLGY